MEITLGLVRDIIEETGRRGVKVNTGITRKYFREPSFNLKIFFCYLNFFFPTKCFVATHIITKKIFGWLNITFYTKKN